VRVWQLHSLVPTISVPNWAALVTGVPPEINGFARAPSPFSWHYNAAGTNRLMAHMAYHVR